MKENKNKKVVNKEIRGNKDLVEFILFLKENNISIEEKNKNSIEGYYSEKVGLKFWNIERVFKRNLREGLSERFNILLNEKGLSKEEYIKYGNELIVISNNDERNYF